MAMPDSPTGAMPADHQWGARVAFETDRKLIIERLQVRNKRRQVRYKQELHTENDTSCRQDMHVSCKLHRACKRAR